MSTSTAIAAVTATQVAHVIRSNRFLYVTEADLHDGIEAVLTAAGLPVRREVRLVPSHGRIDLLVGRVGVEVKTAGGWEAVARQLQRYAHSDVVDHLMLVTTKGTHRALPPTLAGVPVTVVVVGGVL